MTKRKVILVKPERSPLRVYASASAPAAAHPPRLLPKGGRAARAEVHACEGASVDGLLETAASLTKEQRKELLDRLALGQQEERGADPDLDMWSGAVQEALEAAIGRGPGPMVVRAALGAPRSWEPVRDFMDSSGLSELRVPQRRSVYGLLARIAVDDASSFCEWADVPLGPRVVAQRCANIAAAFDRSFPGYLATGPHIVALMAQRLTGAR